MNNNHDAHLPPDLKEIEDVDKSVRSEIKNATKLLENIEGTINRCNVIKKKINLSAPVERRSCIKSQKIYWSAVAIIVVTILTMGMFGVLLFKSLDSRITMMEHIVLQQINTKIEQNKEK